MRSAAMGGATVAMEGYPGAALINPATIGVDQTIQAQSYLFDQRGAPFKWPYFYINDQTFSFFSQPLIFDTTKELSRFLSRITTSTPKKIIIKIPTQ